MPRIDYVKRQPPAAAAAGWEEAPGAPLAALPSSAAVKDLRYWVGQYRALTAQIQAAEVTNHDQWRKERVNLRGLYSRRSAAAARMADGAERLVGSQD